MPNGIPFYAQNGGNYINLFIKRIPCFTPPTALLVNGNSYFTISTPVQKYPVGIITHTTKLPYLSNIMYKIYTENKNV